MKRTEPQSAVPPTTLLIGLFVSMAGGTNPLDAQEVLVGPNVFIGSTNPSTPVVEPHLAIDPHDPNRMVAAAIVVDDPATSVWIGSHIDVFVTVDGGLTWSQQEIPMAAGADPWLSVDAEGRLYLAYLAQASDPGSVELLYQISENWGETWTSPRSLGGGHDRETLATAHVGEHNMTFLSSSLATTNEKTGITSVYLARAIDGGPLEQLTTRRLNNLQMNTFSTVVTRDGTLIVSLLDYATTQFRMLNTRRAWVLASDDLGVTFSEPRFVADDMAFRTEFVIAADLSARFPHRLYAVRTVQVKDGGKSVVVSHSDDHGATWVDDVSIAGPSVGARPIGPTNIAVDASGAVGVAWFDGRRGLDEGSTDLLFSVSLDGGESFSTATRVTAVSSTNLTVQNGRVAERFAAGGDYFGLVALPGGGFQVLWSDSRTGHYQLYTSRLLISAP